MATPEEFEEAVFIVVELVLSKKVTDSPATAEESVAVSFTD